MEYKTETLKSGLTLFVSDEHKFGTDAFLLSDFSCARHKDRVIDLGTGCGIIPMLIYEKFAPAHIYGVDIQAQAIDQFTKGIETSGVSERIEAVHADFRALPLPAASFDLVVSNPPYKAAGSGLINDDLSHRTARHALNGDLDELCEAAARLLRFGGRFCLCQRPERLAETFEAMKRHGIEPKRLRFVAKHHDTTPWLFLLEGRRGGKPHLTVEPVFAVYERDGSFTKEMQAVYGFSEKEELL